MRCFAFLILGAIIPLGPRCAEDGLLGDFVMGAVTWLIVNSLANDRYPGINTAVPLNWIFVIVANYLSDLLFAFVGSLHNISKHATC